MMRSIRLLHFLIDLDAFDHTQVYRHLRLAHPVFGPAAVPSQER
jgi:hypothetical protein